MENYTGQMCIYFVCCFSDQLIIDVDTDCEDGELYWTDVYSGKISKSKMDGSEETVVIKGMVELSLM